VEGGLDIFQILLESGIVVKLVLLILIACSILSWAIILQKRKAFRLISENNDKFFQYFQNSTNLIDIHEQVGQYPDSTLGTMFESGYQELRKIREKLHEAGKEKELRQYLDSNGIDALERSLKQGANVSSEKLENRLSTLASIGSITPFIGLFGTVWGIIDSFAGLASGGGSIEAVAPGIAEALVATAVGLAAAIPAVWGYNVYNSMVGKFNGQMENFGQDFLNLIERNVLISKE
jgi:biopolymer transport protein TolQ